MTAKELRKRYIAFFKKKGHKEIASASLFPENDPSVLFTAAGMHPLIPFLLGEKHPQGNRLVNVQKCVRTGDIDEVGDDFHLTFFEMLGNWSLGDYYKAESIAMSFEFLTVGLGIPASKLAVTVFAGDEAAPRDQEAYELWQKQGLPASQIYFYGRDENWWGPAGIAGPCGPDTEIFYDMGKPKCGVSCGPACHCGKYVEIWNNVFMEYNQNTDGSYTTLAQKNVDTGMSLERLYAVVNGMSSVYETEFFAPILSKARELTGIALDSENKRQYRIICEHTRAVTFILGDPKAIAPSNTEQGYIVRRLIRRTIRHSKSLFGQNIMAELAAAVIGQYGDVYPEIAENKAFIFHALEKEAEIFEKTLAIGLKKAEKCFLGLGDQKVLDGDSAFMLFDTFGFPIELTVELASEKGFAVDLERFYQRFSQHQAQSRQGAAGKFKGGLADNSEQTTKLHTATHLLHGALEKVLGEPVFQRGSNITAERLRFDFSFGRKLTVDELQKVSAIVNEAILKNIPVICEEMSREEAKKQGAEGVFDEKYESRVKVYSIEGYSKEICGGPHVSHTGALKSFKIIKEESSSAGVRRVKAVVG